MPPPPRAIVVHGATGEDAGRDRSTAAAPGRAERVDRPAHPGTARSRLSVGAADAARCSVPVVAAVRRSPTFPRSCCAAGSSWTLFSYPTVHTQQSTVPPGVAEHNVMGAFVTFRTTTRALRSTCWPTWGRTCPSSERPGRKTVSWSRRCSWAAAQPYEREPRSTSTSSRSLRRPTTTQCATSCPRCPSVAPALVRREDPFRGFPTPTWKDPSRKFLVPRRGAHRAGGGKIRLSAIIRLGSVIEKKKEFPRALACKNDPRPGGVEL